MCTELLQKTGCISNIQTFRQTKRKKQLSSILICIFTKAHKIWNFGTMEGIQDLDVLTSKYDNIILMGDFNAEPVDTVISDFCEIYNLIVFSRISNFFEDVFSQYQCGFCKSYNAQHCLLVMVEKWKKIVDCGGVFGVLLTDLSKALDCIPHDLFIARLEQYRFQTDALSLVYDYLSNRKQRARINETFSCWKDTEYGVPQRYSRSTIIQYTFM